VGFRSGMAIFIAAVLAGCGSGKSGDDTPPAPALTGIFQGGNVAGIRYRTPTRSGVTDANGAFGYLAGETVTFSIGAIELGSAPGAAAISPFTLAGLTAPTTESALRLELNRATRSVTPFVRAMNITRLLLALDVDNDPSTGIDVGVRASLLANATLDLGGSATRFALQLDRLAPDLARNIPLWAPVVHLYRAVNVTVPAHAAVRTETEGGFLGAGLTGVSTTSYAANGLLESRITDADGNGVPEEDIHRTYDGLGRQLTSRQVHNDFFLFNYVLSSSVTYDGFGNALHNVFDVDMGGDGTIDSRSALDTSFDAFGRERTSTQTGDAGLDGVDSRREYTFTYDARGNPQTLVQLIDEDADGNVDGRIIETFVHDAEDRPVSRVYEEDFDANGVIDSRQALSITWAQGGRLVTQVNITDQDADGMPDYSSTTVWNYDAAERLGTWTYESDAGANGSIEYREQATVTRDSQGREVRNVQSHDINGDGIAESILTLVREYDAFDNEVSYTEESDFDSDGVANWRRVVTTQFGTHGEPIESRAGSDNGADGSIESTSVTRFSNELISAGVAMLAQKYFDEGIGYGAVAVL
jgi:hypothetical protein